jgi:phosphatidylglycerophosphate synthase
MTKTSKEPYVCKINEEGIVYIKSILKTLIPLLSEYVTSPQLTLCTLLWSIIIILSGYMARKNRWWLMVSIIALIGHFITDLLDGEMSIYQNDGLDKWNFFMDHLLDFILAISVFIGLALYFTKHNNKLILPLFIIFSLLIINMAASFLLVAEKGLDLGITINGCFTFNIFHMHVVLIAFYIIIIAFRKLKIKQLWIWLIAIFIGWLTVFNIYKKQDDLKKTNIHII